MPQSTASNSQKWTGIILAFWSLILCGQLSAQVSEDPAFLSLDRLFKSQEFIQERFGPARWLADGSGYTTLEASDKYPGADDIIRYEPESGQREILVPAAWLIPEDRQTPLPIEDYAWSPDGNKLLIFTNTQRVWRQNTRGDYWVLHLKTKELFRLGGATPPSTLMFAKFSPDNRWVGYVRSNNIYIQELDSRRTIRMTSDGNHTVINGTFDWVYEEELGLRDGFRWSPDSRFIAYWQLDSEGVGDFYLINNTDSLYPRITPIPYPKVGETNSSCRVGVVDIRDQETVWMQVPGDPRNHYIARMEWAPDSKMIVMQQLNRLQNTNQVMLGDISRGTTKTILTERDEAWAALHDDFLWMDGGEHFIWTSERDGWRHVYQAATIEDNLRLLTPGEMDVVRVAHIDPAGGWLYFIASPDNPTQRYLYRRRLDGNGSPERLSPQDQNGTHSYQISADSAWAFHTYSRMDTPPVIDLIRLPGHEVVRTLAANAGLKSKVDALKRQPPEFFRVDIGDGVELDAFCMKPHDFDSEKSYPLLIYVYGEPAGQTVADRWGGSRYLWHLMLAQQGYLVMSIDNRGTNSPRGRQWRKSIYRQIGILASQDQAAALRTILKLRPYIDPERTGIWGWSGGGSMSLNMIFRFPRLYGTAMAVAFVADQRYYDSIYQERYMGLPDDNAEGFKQGSPITFAHQLEGNLLIVHGTGDDNVHYQNCEALINELIRHNKSFTMMSYPNRTHGIREGENTTRHLYGLLTRYLREHVPPGPLDR